MVQRLARIIVTPTLARNISTQATTTKSSGLGISRSGRPWVQPKKNPTRATTPVTVSSPSCTRASLGQAMSRPVSSGTM